MVGAEISGGVVKVEVTPLKLAISKVSRKRSGTGLRQSIPLSKPACGRTVQRRAARRRKKLPVGAVPRNGVKRAEAAGSPGSNLFRVVPSVHRYFHFPERKSSVNRGAACRTIYGRQRGGDERLSRGFAQRVFQSVSERGHAGRTDVFHSSCRLDASSRPGYDTCRNSRYYRNVEFTIVPDTA